MMSEILHANIFFFIASLATVAFVILVSMAMYQVIKILIAIRKIVERIEAGSDMITEDITTMRNFVVKGGLINHLISLVMPKSPHQRRQASKKDKFTSDT